MRLILVQKLQKRKHCEKRLQCCTTSDIMQPKQYDKRVTPAAARQQKGTDMDNLNAIVAVYEDWGIGDGGTQQIVIPEDRKHFQELTKGNAIVVGRKTLADFPDGKPLPDRTNIVLTADNDFKAEGAIIVHSLDELFATIKDMPKVYVVGGASVYSQLLKFCERVYITRIYVSPKSDSYFPNLDENFNWSCEEFGDAKVYDGIKYRFCEYETYDISKNIRKQ